MFNREKKKKRKEKNRVHEISRKLDESCYRSCQFNSPSLTYVGVNTRYDGSWVARTDLGSKNLGLRGE